MRPCYWNSFTNSLIKLISHGWIWSGKNITILGHHLTRWRLLWWKDILKLTPIFRGISKVNIVCGTMVLFWKDLWDDQPLQDSHPCAFSHSLNKDVSVKDFLGITSLGMAFHLPLSPQALDEVRHMQTIASSFQPMASSSDVWHYTWGKTIFKATDYYRFFFRDIQLGLRMDMEIKVHDEIKGLCMVALPW